jgi:hypothetical protein
VNDIIKQKERRGEIKFGERELRELFESFFENILDYYLDKEQLK